MSDRALFWVAAWEGAHQGGAFEAPWIIVSEHDASGTVRRFDQYDLDQLDEARARFAKLRPDPLRIPANAAMRASDRHASALEARDWQACEALCAADMIFESRRRLVRTNGGREMFMASNRHFCETGTRVNATVLATAGDRLVLEHLRWLGHTLTPDFEMENLSLSEVDADGRLVAVLRFDPEDWRDASRELLDRYARSDEARSEPPGALELRRGVLDRDVERARAVLPDDFVFDDHRRTGPGRIEGREKFIAWLGSLFERSPDAIVEPMYRVTVSELGAVYVGHTFGTLRDGGRFEFVWAQVVAVRDGRLAMIELFELEDLAAADARFYSLAAEARQSARTSAGA
jgi:ketosteroid isomerase-like protein